MSMTADDTHDDDAPYDRDADQIERASLISYKSVNPSPTTLTSAYYACSKLSPYEGLI